MLKLKNIQIKIQNKGNVVLHVQHVVIIQISCPDVTKTANWVLKSVICYKKKNATINELDKLQQ